MNILVLAPDILPIRGGAGTYVREVFCRMPEESSVHLVTNSPSGEEVREGTRIDDRDEPHLKESVQIHHVRTPGPSLVGDAVFKAKVRARIRQLIAQNDIHVVHSCSTMPDLLVPVGRLSIPFVTTVHSTIEDHYNVLRHLPSKFRDFGNHEKSVLVLGPILTSMEKHYYGGNRRFISVSAWGKKNLSVMKNVHPTRIRVIHNGVDGSVYRRSLAMEARSVFPLISDVSSPKILILSRLTSSKITPYLSSAIRRITEKSDVRFILAGPVDDRIERELGGKCTFLGQVPYEQTPYLYSLCDVFLLPSLYENFPISLLEAMASECAVVASNVGGIPEVIDDGVNGVLVSPREPDAIVEKLSMLIEDTHRLRTFGRLAREKVEACYSWDTAASKTYDFFEEVISR